MKRSPLAVLLLAYVLLASLYSIVTPIFEASDEIWHYPMVKYVADYRLGLPVQDPNVPTAWRQEGSQPPLYYMLGAALTFWIDTSDLDKVRKINPHADIGVVVPDGNVNMVVHDPAVESFPWRGTVLAVHLVRFLSVALGAVTVAMTYLLTHELFPGQRWLALAAAAFTAFNPMFLFISGSVNNDNLSNALASVLLLMIVRLLKRTTAPTIRDLVFIGLTAGAGMLAKVNIGFLLPLIALALALLAYRLRSWRPLVVGGAITGGLTILIAGWWYLRNAQLYGDVTGLDMMIRIAGPRTIPANLPQLWSERHTFLMSYWGFFGGVNVPLPDAVYTVFNTVALLAVAGLVIGVAKSCLPHPRSRSARDALSPHAERGDHAVLKPLSIVWRGGATEGCVGGEVCRSILLGRAFTAIWIVVLFISLLRWTSVTWASQGRLMFSAIAPLSMWMAVGLWQMPKGRNLVLVVALTWFLLMATVEVPRRILWVYSSSADKFNTAGCRIESDSSGQPVIFREPDNPGPSISFKQYFFDQGIVHSGEYISLEIWFFTNELYSQFRHDWSAFIHLENKDGLIVAQRDAYLGQGQWATSQLGDQWASDMKDVKTWCNHFAVQIPANAYAPQMINVYLGFYDLQTGDRMIAAGPNATADNRVYLGTVQLLPRGSSLNVPNPMSVNFGDEADLVGYDVSSLTMYPGKQVTVTLYWRARHPMTTNYQIFAQIVEPNSTNVFGGNDTGWSPPTTAWKPGEIIKDEHTFTIHSDASPGTWQIVAGMYRVTGDNQFQRLRVITPDGGEANDFVELSRVKMNLPPVEF